MRNYGKKILGVVAAATMLCSVALTTGCGKTDFKMPAPNAADFSGEVKSNGGFAVEKGNYIYFINGSAENTADNTYGEVVKGSLMRITKAQLAAGEYDEAERIVPSLFVSKNYDAGIFVYGDYLYYATPTTDKNLQGEVENSYIDFKCLKLDGSEAPMEGKFFHLASANAFFRFVEEDGVVYCLYQDGTSLKSYNTVSKKHTVLVKGASSYFYDMKDTTNGNVYYTMPVTYDIATDIAKQTSDYNQLYCVNAAATAKEVGKKAEGKISYTVEGKEADKDETYTKTYTFDAEYLENDYANFKSSDYTTYPYVNLGQLVLDGVGASSFDAGWFNEDNKADSLEFGVKGYTYTVARYENGGVYFTRNTDTKLYYLSDERDGKSWNTIKANDAENTAEVDIVALDVAKASSAALFMVDEDENTGVRTHTYLYHSGSTLSRATAEVDGTQGEVVDIIRNISAATLWKTEGDFLYYYTDYNNGNNLSRVKYTGDKEAYKSFFAEKEGYEDYQPVTIPLVEWSKDWYKPEIFVVGENKAVVLYSNVQKYGNSLVSYGYVYAAQIGTTKEIQDNIDNYEAYTEYLETYSDSDKEEAQKLIKYFFSASTVIGKDAAKLSDEVIELYKDKNKAEDEQDALYKEVLGKFTVADGAEKAELVTESEIIGLVGQVLDEDKDAIENAWKDTLLKPDADEEEDNSLPGWAIALIVIGAVLVVAAGAAVPVIIILKKKAAAKREAEATVNAYRRKKIDTTDDKSIDVYADEKEDEAAEEETETPAEEPAENTQNAEEEAPAEEVEAPVSDGEEKTE